MPKDSAVKSVADLRGKKVALNKGSNVHYLLVKALEKAGLKYTDIEPVFLAPSDALAAFSRGSVDAWVIWDPYEAAAEASTGARILADGTGVVSNYQFYFTSKNFLGQRRQGGRHRARGAQRSRRLDQKQHRRGGRTIEPFGRPAGIRAGGVAQARVLRNSADQRCTSIASQQRIADTFLNLESAAESDHGVRSSAQTGILIMTKTYSATGAVSRQHPLVPADPWRRALSRHHHRRPRRQLQLSAPDRAGGRPARLFRRAAADRA